MSFSRENNEIEWKIKFYFIFFPFTFIFISLVKLFHFRYQYYIRIIRKGIYCSVFFFFNIIILHIHIFLAVIVLMLYILILFILYFFYCILSSFWKKRVILFQILYMIDLDGITLEWFMGIEIGIWNVTDKRSNCLSFYHFWLNDNFSWILMDFENLHDRYSSKHNSNNVFLRLVDLILYTMHVKRLCNFDKIIWAVSIFKELCYYVTA